MARRNALDRAADEMRSELNRFDISVPEGERKIIWRDLVVEVNHGTPLTDCRRKLKKMLQAAIKAENKDRQTELLTNRKEQ